MDTEEAMKQLDIQLVVEVLNGSRRNDNKAENPEPFRMVGLPYQPSNYAIVSTLPTGYL